MTHFQKQLVSLELQGGVEFDAAEAEFEFDTHITHAARRQVEINGAELWTIRLNDLRLDRAQVVLLVGVEAVEKLEYDALAQFDYEAFW